MSTIGATPPSVRQGIARLGSRLTEAASTITAQPVRRAVAKGVVLGAASVGAGMLFATQPVLAGIMGASVGGVLGASGAAKCLYNANNEAPTPGEKLACVAFGACMGVGLAMAGAFYPGMATLVTSTLTSAAMGYVFRKVNE